MATNLWTADRRIYLDAKGAAVEADDPTRQTLLVAQGSTIPLAEAERLGLIEVTPAEVKVKAAPSNKAKSAPANKNG